MSGAQRLVKPSKLAFFAKTPAERAQLDAEWEAWCGTPEAAAERAEEQRIKAQREAREACDLRDARFRDARNCSVTDAMGTALVYRSGLLETASLKAARTWLQNPKARPWLVLSGGTGAGKSIAAAWVLTERGAVWISANQLNRIFAANFGEQLEEQQSVCRCHTLVLDDVGGEHDAARMCSALLEILDSRKSHSRTIVTTNLGKKAFADRYANERLTSRLHELVEWHGDAGPDLRRANRGKPQ